MSVTFVVKQSIAFERREVHIWQTVVIVIGHPDTHRVLLNVETAAAGDVAEGAVVVVAVESGKILLARVVPVAIVQQNDICPAVPIQINKRSARTERFRKIFFSCCAAVMNKANASLRGHVRKAEARTRLGSGTNSNQRACQ